MHKHLLTMCFCRYRVELKMLLQVSVCHFCVCVHLCMCVLCITKHVVLREGVEGYHFTVFNSCSRRTSETQKAETHFSC